MQSLLSLHALLFSFYALLFFTPITLSLSPSSPSSTSLSTCTNGSFKSCIASQVCIQSFPSSCICENDVRRQCARACGISESQLAGLKVEDGGIKDCGGLNHEGDTNETAVRTLGSSGVMGMSASVNGTTATTPSLAMTTSAATTTTVLGRSTTTSNTSSANTSSIITSKNNNSYSTNAPSATSAANNILSIQYSEVLVLVLALVIGIGVEIWDGGIAA